MCEWWVAGRVRVSRGARGRQMCVAMAGAVRVAGAAAMRTFLVNVFSLCAFREFYHGICMEHLVKPTTLRQEATYRAISSALL